MRHVRAIWFTSCKTVCIDCSWSPPLVTLFLEVSAAKSIMEGLRGAFAGQQLTSCRPAARQAQIRVQTSCVATPTRPPATKLAKRSKVEIVKEQSDYLRHPLMEELVNENLYINEDAVQLMKFHGSYQQDHREKRAFGQGKFYQFMMRTRQPGGTVPNQLYLTMDDLSDQVCFHSNIFPALVLSAHL